MVVIRADGNGKIGMGHYMRCFAIAHELRQRGEEVCFLLAPDADVETVRKQGYSLYQLKKAVEPLGWDAAEAADWIKGQGKTTVLIDTYRIDRETMTVLADAIHKSYYMDDLYAFDYPVANIINYNLEASKDTYKDLLTGKPKLYIGPTYYPVREEILCAKVKYLRSEARRIFITTGATDPFHVELTLLKSLVLNRRIASLELIVQCGLYYEKEYVEELQKFAAQYKCVTLQGWTKDMGALYASCDICITTGSSSMSEAMTVGIPCISFAFVDNHLNQCHIMDKKGMAPYAGDFRKDPEKVCQSVEQYLLYFLDVENRNFARAKFAGVFDGKGTARIAKILAAPQRKVRHSAKCATAQSEEWRRIIGIRASAIIYNFILSNHIKGTALMPANICECVPAIYKKAGMEFLFCDIEFGTWVPDEEEILSLLSDRPDIKVLHYNRTYGEMGDHNDFFQEVRSRFPSIVIVDDRCLALPDWQGSDCQADLTIYSTGNTKPVCIGKGAFGFLKKSWKYERYHLGGDIETADAAFDASIKRCHAEHKSAEWNILLDNWTDPAQMPDEGYEQEVLKKLARIVTHKAAVNEIYKKLPDALPEGMHDWRYNLLVREQDKCIQRLFQKGLFASKHYLGLGNGYFCEQHTPNCDWLAKHVINLFNDGKYTVAMAERTVKYMLIDSRH